MVNGVSKSGLRECGISRKKDTSYLPVRVTSIQEQDIHTRRIQAHWSCNYGQSLVPRTTQVYCLPWQPAQNSQSTDGAQAKSKMSPYSRAHFLNRRCSSLCFPAMAYSIVSPMIKWPGVVMRLFYSGLLCARQRQQAAWQEQNQEPSGFCWSKDVICKFHLAERGWK